MPGMQSKSVATFENSSSGEKIAPRYVLAHQTDQIVTDTATKRYASNQKRSADLLSVLTLLGYIYFATRLVIAGAQSQVSESLVKHI